MNKSNSECKVEPLNPWDASIKSYIEPKRAPIACKQLQPRYVVYDRQTRRLQIDKVVTLVSFNVKFA